MMCCHELFAVVQLYLVFNIYSVTHVKGAGWNYRNGSNEGPENWYRKFPDCGGVMQSPIDINTSYVLYDPNLQLFDFSEYSNTDGVIMTLENVGGHTAEVIYTGNEVHLKGGSLPDKYVLEQFHFHWGLNDRRGSEHGFNGDHHPMEIHFVHRQSRQPNVTAAAPHPFGLAVVAAFFKIGNENKKYNKLLDYFDKISNANSNVVIPTFAITDLLPISERYDYFRYHGSLTTPPCYESVIWSILTELIEISEEQVEKFRALYDEEYHHLVDDYRPIQTINERSVLTTHFMYKQRAAGGAGCVTIRQTFVLAMLCLVICFF